MKGTSARLFIIEHPASEAPVQAVPPPPPTSVADGRPPRVRTSTLDRFNEEMAVLDRPLEDEVEYYDEPRPRRWRVPAIGLAIFVLSCGSYLAATRYRAAQASAEAAKPATAAVAAAVAPPPAPPAPVMAPPAPAAIPAAPAAVPTAARQAPPSSAKPAAPVALEDSKGGDHHHHSRHAGGHHHRHARRGGHARG